MLKLTSPKFCPEENCCLHSGMVYHCHIVIRRVKYTLHVSHVRIMLEKLAIYRVSKCVLRKILSKETPSLQVFWGEKRFMLGIFYKKYLVFCILPSRKFENVFTFNMLKSTPNISLIYQKILHHMCVELTRLLLFL